MENTSTNRSMRRRKPRRSHEGKALRAVSFPLGGIGAGQLAICGDGGLRQWQIFNNINHVAHVPLSFFAVRAARKNAKPQARILLTNAQYGGDFEPAPLISDHIVPDAARLLLKKLPGVEGIAFIGEYPTARIDYSISEFPVEVRLEAYSPFIPLDAEDSGLPAAIFHFTIANPAAEKVEASVLMCQQNAVGWDDTTKIEGVRHQSFGGNRNRVLRRPGLTAVELTNPTLPEGHPREGEMLIAALSGDASVRAQWVELEDIWEDFRSDGRLDSPKKARPSPKGHTVNAAIAAALTVEPESEKQISFLLVWRFPNRYVDWTQSTLWMESGVKKSRLWLGNHYSSRFGSALATAEYVRDNLDRGGEISARLSVSWGRTVVRELRLACESSEEIVATINSKSIPLSARKARARLVIRLNEPVEIKENQSLRVSIG